jgi:putative addiction module component (TIGR02574 family)
MAIDIQELRDLPLNEKLQIVNLLWDDLHAATAIQLPEAELREIRRRDLEMREHPVQALTLEQMWAKVDELRQ